jgi:hypothetical protein
MQATANKQQLPCVVLSMFASPQHLPADTHQSAAHAPHGALATSQLVTDRNTCTATVCTSLAPVACLCAALYAAAPGVPCGCSSIWQPQEAAGRHQGPATRAAAALLLSPCHRSTIHQPGRRSGCGLCAPSRQRQQRHSGSCHGSTASSRGSPAGSSGLQRQWQGAGGPCGCSSA